MAARTTRRLELPRDDADSLWVEYDEADEPIVASYKWRAHKGPANTYFYAVTCARWQDGRERTLGMHVLLMGQTGVDHIDMNGLNNRRNNLRIATRSQNTTNRPKARGDFTSRYKGVSRDKNRWRATIRIGGVKVSLGSFLTEEAAAAAYDSAALDAFGEFARLNLMEV